MVGITIDEALCKRDGLCVAICPLQLILPADDGGVPAPGPEFSRWCIRCGHCVAICPTGALRHFRMGPEQCPEIDSKTGPGPEEIAALLRRRRSVRRFKAAVPERGVLEQLVGLAGYAPSGHNLKSLKWMIFTGRKSLDRFVDRACDWMKAELERNPTSPQAPLLRKVTAAWAAGDDLILHRAPVLMLVHGPTKTGSETSDAALALAYFDLASSGHGLGCCWAGLLEMAIRSWKPLQELVALPEGHKLRGAMVAGYPRYEFRRIPWRSTPKIEWR
ncbi:MAG: hypothetical protein GXO34_05805 [Deltaproteobacteria bacterium]|nr:hypothetical protein [Deltaproteobacteria bacterium]